MKWLSIGTGELVDTTLVVGPISAPEEDSAAPPTVSRDSMKGVVMPRTGSPRAVFRSSLSCLRLPRLAFFLACICSNAHGSRCFFFVDAWALVMRGRSVVVEVETLCAGRRQTEHN